MKKLTLLFLALTLIFSVFAQNSGKGFSYQAVARDANGEIMATQHIEVQFSLMPGQHAVTPDWAETHVSTTDEFGTFVVTIGKGVKTVCTKETYADVNFASADFWLKVEVKNDETFEEVSYAQLLSVPYAEVANNNTSTPIGSIMPFAGAINKIPEGWMLCNGEELSRIDYIELYDVIGNAWGYGDATTTFNLPDLRGLFLRGVAHGSSNDPDKGSRQPTMTGGNTNDAVGSWQNYTYQSHKHSASSSSSSAGSHSHTGYIGGAGGARLHRRSGEAASNYNGLDTGDEGSSEVITVFTGAAPHHTHGISTSISNNGGNETRPRNAYVNYIIKTN